MMLTSSGALRIAVFVVVLVRSSNCHPMNVELDEAAARQLVDGRFNADMQGNYTNYITANWNYNVDISNETSAAFVSLRRHW